MSKVSLHHSRLVSARAIDKHIPRKFAAQKATTLTFALVCPHWKLVKDLATSRCHAPSHNSLCSLQVMTFTVRRTYYVCKCTPRRKIWSLHIKPHEDQGQACSGAIMFLTCFRLAASRRQAQPGYVSFSHRATRKARLMWLSGACSQRTLRALDHMDPFCIAGLWGHSSFNSAIASLNEDIPINRSKSASFFYPSRCDWPHDGIHGQFPSVHLGFRVLLPGS